MIVKLPKIIFPSSGYETSIIGLESYLQAFFYFFDRFRVDFRNIIFSTGLTSLKWWTQSIVIYISSAKTRMLTENV